MTVKVTTWATLVLLFSIPEILPLPLAAIPVTLPVLLRTQSYDVPGTLPLSTIVVIAEPVQMVCADGVATTLGTGFTATVAVIGVPVQVTPALV